MSAADLPASLPTSAETEARDASKHDSEKLTAPAAETEYLVSFTGDDDPRSPKSMSTARKWLIVLIVSSTSLCVACTSSLYTAAYGQIIDEFHIAEEVATLGLSMFVFGLGLSPMILAPLSEVSHLQLYSIWFVY